jgi:fructose/tagatose bisphosphate aldolase
MEKIKSKLGVGPMSSEVIESVFQYSEKNEIQLMLISSKNQIDYNGGYVNNWNTEEYMQFIKKLKEKYPNSEVLICRDHCGPGFNGNFDISDTYNTIKSDIENGFDLIHIDFCHFKGTKEEMLLESKKAIEYCKSLNPKIAIEIGTDENTGKFYSSPKEIIKDLNYFLDFVNPDFYVVQTGSLVMEINQIGAFNKEFVEKIHEILSERNVKLKEHNADYLNKEEITKRENIVDAVNIAPQLGVLQTQILIQKCLQYGINFEQFLKKSYDSKKWEKWLNKNTEQNKFLCSLIAGHYNFSSKEYLELVSKINKYEDFNVFVKSEIYKLLDLYCKNLK